MKMLLHMRGLSVMQEHRIFMLQLSVKCCCIFWVLLCCTSLKSNAVLFPLGMCYKFHYPNAADFGHGAVVKMLKYNLYFFWHCDVRTKKYLCCTLLIYI